MSKYSFVAGLLCCVGLGMLHPSSVAVAQPPGGGPGGPGFGPGGMMGKDREILKQFDKDGNGWLDKTERPAAREFAKKDGGGRRGPGGPGGFGPGGRGPGGPGGRGPGGFSPAAMWSPALIAALDSDKDRKLSQAEIETGVIKLVEKFPAAKEAGIDEAQLAAALTEILPAPPGFPAGPPAGPGAEGRPPEGRRPEGRAPEGRGPEGRGPGGPMAFNLTGPIAGIIMERADADKNGKLTLKELIAGAQRIFDEQDKAKAGSLDEMQLVAALGAVLPARGGPGGMGASESGKPGPKVAVADAKTYPQAALYDPAVLRTIFFEFENSDWEAELSDFNRSDVEVPATMIVDGKKYPNVGLQFRGMSSNMSVGPGSKHSLNVSVDMADPAQKLYGHKTLNLLNFHGDGSLMSTVLFSHIARKHIPAPKANFVKVVINGESWGVFCNVQQFNKEFVAENYKSDKGVARWKVSGSPNGAGGLDYIGDKIDDYKKRYEIKSKDKESDWKALIKLCKTLTETPLDKLEAELAPQLDIDGALWFLAMDNALINSDGYWIRASDYSIVRDDKGIFHVLPHDMNEAFRPGQQGPGMGGRRGPGGPGAPAGPGTGPRGPMAPVGSAGLDLDPLVGMNDARKPLRSRLLQVPSLKAKYLQYVRKIAEESLDWKTLGPVVAQYRTLIDKEVQADTRKLSSYEAFVRATADTSEAKPEAPRGGRQGMSIREFAEKRRAYLLGPATTPK